MHMKKFQNIVVAGGGVLESQIALQAAYCGFDVTIWLRSESSIGRTQPKLAQLKETYLETIQKMASPEGKSSRIWACGIADGDSFDPEACAARVGKAADSIRLELDIDKAVENADLVIESMAENPDDRIAFYQKLAPAMPEKTVLVTNSSTLLPSKFAKYTGRPEKYLALHFANFIWKNNTAEIMAQPATSDEAFQAVMVFAEQIRMAPLPVRKEKIGLSLKFHAGAAAVFGDGSVCQRHLRSGKHRSRVDARNGCAERTVPHSGYRGTDHSAQYRQAIYENSTLPRAVQFPRNGSDAQEIFRRRQARDVLRGRVLQIQIK